MTEIFDEQVFFTKIKHYSIVYFSSDTCMDCDYLKPYLSAMEKLFNDVPFYSVKRHQLSSLFKRYKVFGVPSFIVFNQGEVLASWIDKKRKEPQDIIVFLDRYLNRM